MRRNHLTTSMVAWAILAAAACGGPALDAPEADATEDEPAEASLVMAHPSGGCPEGFRPIFGRPYHTDHGCLDDVEIVACTEAPEVDVTGCAYRTADDVLFGLLDDDGERLAALDGWRVCSDHEARRVDEALHLARTVELPRSVDGQCLPCPMFADVDAGCPQGCRTVGLQHFASDASGECNWPLAPDVVGCKHPAHNIVCPALWCGFRPSTESFYVKAGSSCWGSGPDLGPLEDDFVPCRQAPTPPNTHLPECE